MELALPHRPLHRKPNRSCRQDDYQIQRDERLPDRALRSGSGSEGDLGRRSRRLQNLLALKEDGEKLWRYDGGEHGPKAHSDREAILQ